MKQLVFPGFLQEGFEKVVNVASVPHRSPFRYPGGKTWLVPRVREWLLSLPKRPGLFVEPFAGGGIVALTVAMERLAGEVLMAELDHRVASVWETILCGDVEWLAKQIEDFAFSSEAVEDLLALEDLHGPELAFQTIVRNRVSHGGIMAPGAGMIKNGEAGRGLASRWYPETLSRRIRRIAQARHCIHFVARDGLEVMMEQSQRPDAVFFVDPPYSAPGKSAGRRLYTHHELDHERLFGIAEMLRGDFLMTYDNAASVRRMAESHGFDLLPIAMKSTHHAKMTELLIGRNLDWARETPQPNH